LLQILEDGLRDGHGKLMDALDTPLPALPYPGVESPSPQEGDNQNIKGLHMSSYVFMIYWEFWEDYHPALHPLTQAEPNQQLRRKVPVTTGSGLYVNLKLFQPADWTW